MVDSVCVCFYTRDVIGDTRFVVGKTSEDIPFNFEIFFKARRIAYVPLAFYYYFNNPVSLSNGVLNRDKLNYLYFRQEISNYCHIQKDIELIIKADALLARAAMGLLTRMALYGISSDMDESYYKKLLIDEFRRNSKYFYKSKTIPLNRKILAYFVTNFYPVVKMIGCILR